MLKVDVDRHILITELDIKEIPGIRASKPDVSPTCDSANISHRRWMHLKVR